MSFMTSFMFEWNVPLIWKKILMHVLKIMSCTACGQQLAGPALQTSSAVITGSVFPSHGCVIASQIVWTTPMSHPPAVHVESLSCLQSRAWNHYLMHSLSLSTEDQVYTCNPQQFSCANGNCILETWVCDGNNDCGDNSDEAQELQCGEACHLFSKLYTPAIQCTYYLLVWLVFCISGSRTCKPSDFTCPTWYQGSPRCIPWSYVCDGEKDCVDAADELHNCPNRTCHMNEFACTNGRCILVPFQWVLPFWQYPTIYIKSNAFQNILKKYILCV